MSNAVKISVALMVVGLLAWLAFCFFGVQALFVDREVAEEIPEAISDLLTDPAGSAGGPEGGRTVLLGKGAFAQGDSTYTISGEALLSRVEDRVNLTFVDFEVSNGPDLFVYAVKAGSTENKLVKQTVAEGGFVNLGTLKGNVGDQNYVVETAFDPGEYQVISIWCRRFSRNFGSAHLAAGPASRPR